MEGASSTYRTGEEEFHRVWMQGFIRRTQAVYELFKAVGTNSGAVHSTALLLVVSQIASRALACEDS